MPDPIATSAGTGLHLSVVIPVYYAEQTLELLTEKVLVAFRVNGWRGEIILVNDGSRDRSWALIQRLGGTHPEVKGIDLRRNFGQDNAIMTGLRNASGELVAIMDDDLQHDPADLVRLVEALSDEADVVYGTFRRKHQSWWKNLGSWLNGKTGEWLIDKPKGIYMSPYKLMRRAVAVAIGAYDGPFPYVDGLIFQVTDRIVETTVEHHRRVMGRSLYSFGRSVDVWMRLFSSFSVRPLRVVSWLGAFLAGTGFASAVAVVAYRLVKPDEFSNAVAGWASLMIAVLFIGGVEMMFLGVLGEYVGRTYLHVNSKPQSIIREMVNLPLMEKE